MSDDRRPYVLPPLAGAPATPDRPLQGLTVLVVEDSRFASEAIRLLSIRSGARIRRADSLAAAHRHLRIYRPAIIIIDLGLPDGSGADLIADLAQANPRVSVILGMSGDPDSEAAAMAAGADGFLAKPVESLAVFQQIVLQHLPMGDGNHALRALPQETIAPDQMAFADDLVHAAELIDAPDRLAWDYIAQFVGGVARSAHDDVLEDAAERLVRARSSGTAARAEAEHLSGVVHDRLGKAEVV